MDLETMSQTRVGDTYLNHLLIIRMMAWPWEMTGT